MLKVGEGKSVKEKLVGILHRLFGIYSPSGGEDSISGYSGDFLASCGFSVYRDEMGNIMASRGKCKNLPLLSAHLDTLQDELDIENLEKIMYDRRQDVFQMDGVHLGCDDKAGIAVILYLAMYSCLEFKALLAVREKNWRTGIRNIPHDFYLNTCWAFCLDGSGSNTVITRYKNRDICSGDFVYELFKIGENEGLLLREGISRLTSSAYYISEYVPNTINFPIGFYNHHRRGDYLKVSETYDSLKLVKKCIENKESLTKPEHGSLCNICAV